MSDISVGRQDGTLTRNTRHQFHFTGSGKEFFGIWIVNILLSIVTLGIYSAWAKVRTKRYFNGNTELAGHRFDYHANPVSILKGRIIVVVILIVLNLLSQLNPILGLLVLVFYAIALPWVIVRGLRFNANMTSYRNIRFHFEGTKWAAFMAYILWPILALITLGGLIPFASRASARFLGNGHSFGTAKFSAEPPLRPYYKGLGIIYLLLLIPLIALAILVSTMGTGSAALDTLSGVGFVIIFMSVLMLYAGLIFSGVIYSVYSRNNSFGHLELAHGHKFSSSLKVGPFLWLVISNAFLTIITLTLYYPWAKVRIARYLANNTALTANGDLDSFAASQVDSRGVASGEFLDIEGIDFGF